MQAGKMVAGLLGVMMLAGCGASAGVTPTPLNPAVTQATSMQTYGPGAVTTDPTQSYVDAAPTVATGEEEPAPEESVAPEPTPEPTATPTPEPTASEDPTIPIMDDSSSDEPAPKPTLIQKAKTFLSGVVDKVKSIFKKS